jgi:signal transduction histidine kinase
VPSTLPYDVTTKDSGMGIGLAISRSIIEAHGGHIVARNFSARPGAAFTIDLPLLSPRLGRTIPRYASVLTEVR